MTPMIRLPIEIIAEIIAAVMDGTDFNLEDPGFCYGHDEHHPLATASLVSRTWSTICRPHIFRIICISTINIDKRLWFLHFEASHLSELIRTVLLCWDDEPDTTPTWYPECFARLKNLCALHVDHRVSNLLLEPGPLAMGISSMFAAPRLRKLVLWGWDFAEDGPDLMAILPARLEELVLKEIDVPSDVGVTVKSVLRLEALRSLELQVHPMLRLKNFIECPNLDRLCAQWYDRDHSWDLPPWIPSSLSELVLYATPNCNIPDFGTAIHPSVVKIFQSEAYLKPFIWIKDCIGHLPFPNSIQTLILDIENTQFDCDDIFPSLSEYEMLSRFLLQLYEGGGLKGITLNITASVASSYPELSRGDEAQELAKLKTGFGPLLKENVLDVAFIIFDWVEEETIMRCSIESSDRVKHASRL